MALRLARGDDDTRSSPTASNPATRPVLDPASWPPHNKQFVTPQLGPGRPG